MINQTQWQILERELNSDFMKLLKSAIQEGWIKMSPQTLNAEEGNNGNERRDYTAITRT